MTSFLVRSGVEIVNGSFGPVQFDSLFYAEKSCTARLPGILTSYTMSKSENANLEEKKDYMAKKTRFENHYLGLSKSASQYASSTLMGG